MSLRSPLWALARLVGQAPLTTEGSRGRGLNESGARGGAGGSPRARVGGPLWAVGGLGLAPGLGMGGGWAWPWAWPPLPASRRPRASPRLSHRRHRREHGTPRRPRRAAVARPPAGGPLRYGLGLRAELRLGVGVCGVGSWGPREDKENKLPSRQGAQSRDSPPERKAGRPWDVPDPRAEDTPALEQTQPEIASCPFPALWELWNLRLATPGNLGYLESGLWAP